jgi:hypothetical protein
MERFLKLLKLWEDRFYSDEAEQAFMDHLNSFSVSEVFEIHGNIKALISLFTVMSDIKGLFVEVWKDL